MTETNNDDRLFTTQSLESSVSYSDDPCSVVNGHTTPGEMTIDNENEKNI